MNFDIFQRQFTIIFTSVDKICAEAINEKAIHILIFMISFKKGGGAVEFGYFSRYNAPSHLQSTKTAKSGINFSKQMMKIMKQFVL